MSDPESAGLVADLARCSLHDGPGIRTTVFLKGCNLDCQWCHNPETISFEPQILYQPEKCIHCGQCADGCYSGARSTCGRRLGVSQVLSEILADAPYYGTTGGVTLSGGEPLCQWAFTRDILAACRTQGLHTAVESNMAAPFARISEVLRFCDLLLADLKIWEEEAHREYTGHGNRLIKENIRRASAGGVPVILHTPVVPGVNDTKENIAATAAFAAGLPTLVFYELLPYHAFGQAKGLLDGPPRKRFAVPEPESLTRLAAIAAAYGIPVRIAGRPYGGKT